MAGDNNGVSLVTEDDRRIRELQQAINLLLSDFLAVDRPGWDSAMRISIQDIVDAVSGNLPFAQAYASTVNPDNAFGKNSDFFYVIPADASSLKLFQKKGGIWELIFNIPFSAGAKLEPITVAGLRALNSAPFSENYYTTDTGKQGVWRYDNTDIATADNTGTVLVTANGRRYKRIYDGPVNGTWFGVVGDYVKATALGTDNTAAFQKAIDYIGIIGGGVLTLPTGNYLISGELLVNFGGSRPFTLDTGIGSMRNSAALVNGVTLIKNTPGDLFKVNLKADGSVAAADPTSQYHAFSIKGLNGIATVAGVNMFRMFRTCSNIDVIASDGFDWIILQSNTDSGTNGNYCDKTSTGKIKCGNPRIGAIRLCKPDATSVERIDIEGDAYNYSRAVEVVTGNSVKVGPVLLWHASGSDAEFTPVPGSVTMNFVNCSSVEVEELYIEHCPHETMINFSGCIGVEVSKIFDKFSRRLGVSISGLSKGIHIGEWTSYSTILDGAADIRVAAAAVDIKDITYDKCYMYNYDSVTKIARELNISQDTLNAVREIAKYKDINLTITANQLMSPNSTYILGVISANRTLTLPAITNNYGKEITLYNRNTSTFNWIFNLPIKDRNGDDLIIIKPNSVVVIECSNTTNNGWRVKSEYVEAAADIIVGADAAYTILKGNTVLFVPTLTADRLLTLAAAATNKGKRITVFNTSAVFRLNSSVTMVGAGGGVSTDLNYFPPTSAVILVSDGANWRIESVYGITPAKYLPVASTTDAVTKAFLNATYLIAEFPIGSEIDYYNQGMVYKRVTATIWREYPTNLTV